MRLPSRELAGAAVLLAGLVAAPAALAGAGPAPDVLLITVDTLRADRLSGAGYRRPTSPHLDALLARGMRFTQARTVEPLTNPSLASLLSSTPPHVHGATRNGIPVRPRLPSLPKLLARAGWDTAAFLGNWTLRDRLSGMGEHWGRYELIESRKRWLGLIRSEATGADLTDAALGWLEARGARRAGSPPVLLWVHYVEPHAPYRLHGEHAGALGIARGDVPASDRYDTEIAAVDAEVGRLLAGWDRFAGGRGLIVFTADHGEAFGEDGEHGHGRVLHDATLRVPLGFVWPGRIPPARVAAPVSLLDVAPTLLGLLGLEPHPFFTGNDHSAPLLAGREPAPHAFCVEAHKGAVQSRERADRLRRAGLLEVGHLADGVLEVVSVLNGRRRLYATPPVAARPAGAPSPSLQRCLQEIRAGLERGDQFPAPELDAESIDRLRALGYL